MHKSLSFASDNLFVGIAGPGRAGRREQLGWWSGDEPGQRLHSAPGKQGKQHGQSRVRAGAFEDVSMKDKQNSEAVLKGGVKLEGRQESEINIKQRLK